MIKHNIINKKQLFPVCFYLNIVLELYSICVLWHCFARHLWGKNLTFCDCPHPRWCTVLYLPVHWVRTHAPSIRSHRGTIVVWPDFQPMRVPEEPVYIDLFRKNPVFSSLHLKYHVHVVPPLEDDKEESQRMIRKIIILFKCYLIGSITLL